MKAIVTIALLTMYNFLTAQVSTSPEATVHAFFKSMYDADVEAMSALMHEGCTLQSTGDKNNELQTVSKENFLKSLTNAEPGQMDEQIANLETNIDDRLATVWMDYAFYFNGKLSHCGINNFTLVKFDHDWKIIRITDSRRKSPCLISDTKEQIEYMLDQWHTAAAKADSSTYFGLMTPTSIYVGTDATEVWTKSDFLSFAAPYFRKGNAWDFRKISRNIYSDKYSTKVWFDELLDTWMGVCRGSGLVVKTSEGWKVEHYVLSVTVSNDDIESYIKLTEK